MQQTREKEDYQEETGDTPLLEFRDLTKTFKSGHVKNYALDHVNLKVKRRESVSIVGESGSGKTTLGLATVKLIPVSSGEILFEGNNIRKFRGHKLKQFRRQTQMVFQDPYSSLNPFDTVFRTVSIPLYAQRKEIEIETLRETGQKLDLNTAEIRKRVIDMLDKVGLTPAESFLDIYPKKLSGGQRQRIAIARSLITKPKLIVADEPTSMLDVSISAQVLNLLVQLKNDLDFTIIFISHELATARFIADKMGVLNLGRIVEYGPSDAITSHPMHPYSDVLIKSMPEIEGFSADQTIPKSDYDVYNGGIRGCSYAHLCPFKTDICEQERPQLEEKEPGHYIACYHPV